MSNTVNVRWWDGYLETFEAVEVRFGCDLLWMRLVDGANRHVPLRHVRWFSSSVESHEVRPVVSEEAVDAVEERSVQKGHTS